MGQLVQLDMANWPVYILWAPGALPPNSTRQTKVNWVRQFPTGQLQRDLYAGQLANIYLHKVN